MRHTRSIHLCFAFLLTIFPASRPIATGETSGNAYRQPGRGQDEPGLSKSQTQTLQNIIAAEKARRATQRKRAGTTVLFVGPDGPRKTAAAELLGRELGRDLYRVDLTKIVSKYIGETEKNLRRVFKEATDRHAILMFDEAGALFGKRSEVNDSHDRYANIEVNYLLRRMKTYRGLAILATNMKSSVDQAFLRRLRFALDFN